MKGRNTDMRERIDGASFAQAIIHAAASINLQKQQINELNVFPVPDGDTGTNMGLTISTAAAELKKKQPRTVGEAAATNASALLRGARGNSGVILSLLFRGFSKAVKDKDEIDGRDLAIALDFGVAAAYKAVMKPAEGTILTVSRVAGTVAALEAQSNRNMEHVLTCTIAAAKDALAETLHQNPVLEKAGVVDAGGMGFVVILEGMLSSLQGDDIVAPTESVPDMGQEQANFSDFSMRISPLATAPSLSFPGKMTRTRRHCGNSCPRWATVWCWWMMMRSSKSTSTPTIPAPPLKRL